MVTQNDILNEEAPPTRKTFTIERRYSSVLYDQKHE